MSSEGFVFWSLRVVAAFGMTALIGCTGQLADLAEPAGTPPRPAAQSAYPAVHDMPPARDTRPLTAEERRRISEELTSLRDRQEAETTGSVPERKPAGR
jgi:hypothetical protein